MSQKFGQHTMASYLIGLVAVVIVYSLFVACITGGRSEPPAPSRAKLKQQEDHQAETEKANESVGNHTSQQSPPVPFDIDSEMNSSDGTKHGNERGDSTPCNMIGTIPDWLVAIAALLALVVYRGQWQAMREQTDLASKQLTEARIASQQTRESITLARNTANTQLRSYLVAVAAGVVKHDEKITIRCDLTVKNCGQTPAQDVTIRSRIYVTENDYQGPFDFEGLAKRPLGKSIVGAGESIAHAVEDSIPPDYLIAASKGDMTVWFFGRIEYKDVFGNDCWTEFRFTSTGAVGNAPDGLVHASDGNQADYSNPQK